MADVAANCPNLISLVIQREVPLPNMSSRKLTRANKFFQCLMHVEITCSFPKSCFAFIVKNALQLRTVKVFHLPGLKREDFDQVTSFTLTTEFFNITQETVIA
jgi:hypothetical protein